MIPIGSWREGRREREKGGKAIGHLKNSGEKLGRKKKARRISEEKIFFKN